MIGRIAWVLSMICVAVVAVFAQLDRASNYQPAYAPFVPVAFSGAAAERMAQFSVAAQDGPEAVHRARTLIAVRPLPAEHLTLLSLASALNGDEATTIAALEAASMRGWREPFSQLAVARSAMAQGQYDSAAQRLAALLATGEFREAALTMIADLLTTSAGRAAFAQRIAATGHWQDNLQVQISRAADPDDYARTIELAAELGGTMPCEGLRKVAQNYRKDGLDELLARFWPGTCDNQTA